MKKMRLFIFCFIDLSLVALNSCSLAYLEPNVICEDCSRDCVTVLTNKEVRKQWLNPADYRVEVVNIGEYYKVYYLPIPGTYDSTTIFCQLPRFTVLKKNCQIVDNED